MSQIGREMMQSWGCLECEGYAVQGGDRKWKDTQYQGLIGSCNHTVIILMGYEIFARVTMYLL